MSKRPSLAETMRHAVTASEPAMPAPNATGAALPPKPPGREAGFYAATRQGKRRSQRPLSRPTINACASSVSSGMSPTRHY